LIGPIYATGLNRRPWGLAVPGGPPRTRWRHVMAKSAVWVANGATIARVLRRPRQFLSRYTGERRLRREWRDFKLGAPFAASGSPDGKSPFTQKQTGGKGRFDVGNSEQFEREKKSLRRVFARPKKAGPHEGSGTLAGGRKTTLRFDGPGLADANLAVGYPGHCGWWKKEKHGWLVRGSGNPIRVDEGGPMARLNIRLRRQEWGHACLAIGEDRTNEYQLLRIGDPQQKIGQAAERPESGTRTDNGFFVVWTVGDLCSAGEKERLFVEGARLTVGSNPWAVDGCSPHGCILRPHWVAGRPESRFCSTGFRLTSRPRLYVGYGAGRSASKGTVLPIGIINRWESVCRATGRADGRQILYWDGFRARHGLKERRIHRIAISGSGNRTACLRFFRSDPEGGLIEPRVVGGMKDTSQALNPKKKQIFLFDLAMLKWTVWLKANFPDVCAGLPGGRTRCISGYGRRWKSPVF